jgi:hypothetical protein
MGSETTILGRSLSDAEAAIAAVTPLDDLPLQRLLLKALSAKGLRTVSDLAAAPLESLVLGPFQIRRVKQALLLSIAGDDAPARLEEGGLAQLPERVCEVLGRLEDRRRAVIETAHGLWDGHPMERTRISKTLGLANRTVQSDIERGTADLRRLLKPESEEYKRALRSIYLKLLAARQGMAGIHEWKDTTSVLCSGQESAGLAFAFLCRISEVKPEFLVTIGLDDVCYESATIKFRHDQVIDVTKATLLNLGRPMPLDELGAWLRKKKGIETTPGFLRRCFELSRELGLEKSGAVGLRSWSYFDADSLHAMAHAALAAIGKPAHHEKIAAKVDELYPHRAPINPVSLHTMLAIHKEEFVLARHGGIFGLPDWEERAVTSLKDFLVEFLREKDGRATRQDMLAAAQAKGYKPSSVSSILNANKGLFRRAKWGEWELAA